MWRPRALIFDCQPLAARAAGEARRPPPSLTPYGALFLDMDHALRRRLDLSKLTLVMAGDFAGAAKRPASLRTQPGGSTSVAAPAAAPKPAPAP